MSQQYPMFLHYISFIVTRIEIDVVPKPLQYPLHGPHVGMTLVLVLRKTVSISMDSDNYYFESIQMI
jgi:hypothetical protein